MTLYEDSFVLKGYPTPDGRPRYVASPSEEVGIVSASDKKEGAWEFLEFLMSQNDVDEFAEINSRRTQVEKRLEEWMELAYFDFDEPDGEKPSGVGVTF